MPLRDHFHPPLDTKRSWEGFHGAWPTLIVMSLLPRLPPRYFAEPLSVVTDFPDQYEYEVRVYDGKHRRRLVAAVELVSPANKDRPEHRRLFVAKCAALLRQHVCVAIVDFVTIRHFNLYGELLDMVGHTDVSLSTQPPFIYASVCRSRREDETTRLETWAQPFVVGQPLPTVPLWLSNKLAVPLELETSYEETCRVLRME